MSSSRLAALALEAELGLCRARLMSCALGHVFLRRGTSLGFLRAWEKVGNIKREGRNELKRLRKNQTHMQPEI